MAGHVLRLEGLQRLSHVDHLKQVGFDYSISQVGGRQFNFTKVTPPSLRSERYAYLAAFFVSALSYNSVALAATPRLLQLQHRREVQCSGSQKPFSGVENSLTRLQIFTSFWCFTDQRLEAGWPDVVLGKLKPGAMSPIGNRRVHLRVSETDIVLIRNQISVSLQFCLHKSSFPL